MARTNITAHMMVKNEDQWVWYAIQSVLPFVDVFRITDTGSQDHTVKIIKSFSDLKIIFKQAKSNSASDIIRFRQDQLNQTKTDWMWLVDGDEIYPAITAKEVVSLTQKSSLEGIILKRLDMLGDIYHFQPDQKVGAYNLFGRTGHYNLRLLNKKTIPHLSVVGKYPLETYVDESQKPVMQRSKNKYAFTKNPYMHTTYLQRSSQGKNITSTLHRKKYRIEKGQLINSKHVPEVFDAIKPPIVPIAQVERGPAYELMAGMITPLKKIKRSFKK